MEQETSETLGLQALERFLVAAMVELTAGEQTLNSLNVYPVPDGDTGSNVRATWAAFFPPTAQESSSDEDAVRAGLRRMTAAARGNIGVIMSEYVRGCASSLRYDEAGSLLPLDGDRIARVLHAGAAAARRAVEQPVEGTVLSVAEAAAAAAAQRRSSAVHEGTAVSPAAVLDAAVEAATRALKRSPQQLPALADAGVVDSGGAALLFVLEAFARVAGGRHGLPRAKDRAWLDVAPGRGFATDEVCQVSTDGPGFEFMAVAEGLDADTSAALRTALSEHGDSVVVAGGDGVHRVHVHTDDVLGVASLVRDVAELTAPAVTRFAGEVQTLGEIVVDVADPVLRTYARAWGFTVHDESRPVSEDGLLISDGVRDAAPSGVLLGGRSAVHAVATIEACAFEAAIAEPGASVDFAEVAEDAAFLSVVQADSWPSARRLARTRVADVEHVVALVAPGAARPDVETFTEVVQGLCPDVVVMRLESGVLVQLGVE